MIDLKFYNIATQYVRKGYDISNLDLVFCSQSTDVWDKKMPLSQEWPVYTRTQSQF